MIRWWLEKPKNPAGHAGNRAEQFDIGVSPASILAKPFMAMVDHNAEAHGMTGVTQACVKYLFSDAGRSENRLPAACHSPQSSRTEGRTNTSSQSTRHEIVPRNGPYSSN